MSIIKGVRADSDLREEKISSEEIYDGKIMHVYRDIVRLPDGGETSREIIRHHGAVCIVPLFYDNTIAMVKQYRYPIDMITLEIPAGKLDSPDEKRIEAAKRELKEETGLTADRWLELGTYYGTPAYSDEKITMYLATDLHTGEQNLDDDEFLKAERMPIDVIVEEILAGNIVDGKTQAAVLMSERLIKSGKIK